MNVPTTQPKDNPPTNRDNLGQEPIIPTQQSTVTAMDKGKDLLGRNRVIGLKNAAGSESGVNPKDRIGSFKVDMTLIPVSAKIEVALALQDGVYKYGEYNWRVEPVLLRTYISAAYRHLDDFLESEQDAKDSLVHHLGHVMACCAIMIDAIKQGTATDDRPINGQPDLMDVGAKRAKRMREKYFG